jgi:lysylphosphatidylglycerol synthetase-like protein (DUF2156 family)
MKAMRAEWARRTFRSIWLPLFVLLGVSWLLAPALAHEHYGTLHLISVEEVGQQSYGWIFRAADVSAGLLIVLGVVGFRITQKSRILGGALLLVAVLSAIDGLFPDACSLGRAACSTTGAFFSAVHDAETVVLGILILAVSLVDATRRRRSVSIYFVALQIILALLALLSGTKSQRIIVIQYIYEFGVISWLAWLVGRYSRPPVPGPMQQVWLRRTFGFWALLAGAFSLISSVPHTNLIPHLGVIHVPFEVGLFEQHRVVAGVLLLYVSRHIFRGERPAAWLLLALFASQVIAYGVLTPQPIALVFSLLGFVLLVQYRNSFYRNTEVPPLWSRLQDVGVVACGVIIALLAALLIATLSGHRAALLSEAAHLYDRPYTQIAGREHFAEAHEHQLELAVQALGITTGAVVLWSLFRPKGKIFGSDHTAVERDKMQALLAQYSDNTEDYFKLWPAEHKRYYHDQTQNGMVTYRVVGGVAYALADPVAASPRARKETLASFLRYARTSGWTTCFLLVSEQSKKLYEGSGLGTIKIGSSAVVDTELFMEKTRRSKWWRWQKNRAERSGWEYNCLAPPYDNKTFDTLRAVSDAWLSRAGRAEHGFALGYFDRVYLGECRLHVLKNRAGEIIAFANELPLLRKDTQASVDLLRFLPDEDGAMPSLLMHAISQTGSEGYRTFDLGFVPLAGIETNFARLGRLLGSNRFAASGLEQFKNKFQPDWTSNYIAYDGDVLDLARAMANLERLFAVEQSD